MNQRLVNTFMDLVKIDSVTGEEEKLADYLIRYLNGKVNLVQKDSFGNLYARIDGEGEPIFLSAHLDTVEPGRGINPQIRHGVICSDGRTILGGDNKIALACFLELVNFLAESKVSHTNVELVLTRSEEIGNYGAINFDYSLLQAKNGFCFDCASPVGTIVTSSPYYERFDLILIGKEGHASRPDEAVNILGLLKNLLSDWQMGRLDEETIFNIGIINGGYARNTIPGRLDLKGEIRSMSETKIENYKKKFIALLERVVANNSRYKIEFVRENSGYVITSSDVRSIVKQIAQLGIEANLAPSWGVSDANIFNERGLKCFNLGDGGQWPHSLKERVKITELEKLSELIKRLVG